MFPQALSLLLVALFVALLFGLMLTAVAFPYLHFFVSSSASCSPGAFAVSGGPFRGAALWLHADGSQPLLLPFPGAHRRLPAAAAQRGGRHAACAGQRLARRLHAACCHELGTYRRVMPLLLCTTCGAAGATLLALCNGSPAVFTLLAAMSSVSILHHAVVAASTCAASLRGGLALGSSSPAVFTLLAGTFCTVACIVYGWPFACGCRRHLWLTSVARDSCLGRLLVVTHKVLNLLDHV